MKLLLLPGDGIGPEIAAATETVLRAVEARYGLGLSLTRRDIGFPALEAEGTTIPDAVIAEARGADGVVLGPVSHNAYPPTAGHAGHSHGSPRPSADVP
uniref:isocitrate/isopropylmalate family dehydrogenase n=1 Tax=Gemmobacter sp. LW-1 TaxID=1529005 RepID=UPI000AEE6EDC